MGTLTVSGMNAGLPSGQAVFGPITVTSIDAGVGQTIVGSLADGDNVFTLPGGSVWTQALINLGNGPTATVTVRTNLNAEDVGLPIAPYPNVGWASFPIVSGVTEIILNSNGAVPDIEIDFI